jgi:hypothetical protein
MYGYLLWRAPARRTSSRIAEWTSYGVTCVAVALCFGAVAFKARITFELVGILRENFPHRLRLLFFPVQYFGTTSLIILTLVDRRVRDLKSFTELWRNHELLPLELLLVNVVVGALPVLFLNLSDHNTLYFCLDQRYLALCLLTGYAWGPSPALDRMGEGLRLRSISLSEWKSWPRHLLRGILALYLLWTTGENLFSAVDRFRKSTQRLRTALDAPPSSTLRDRQALLRELLHLRELPLDEKRRSALFIPQSNSIYWNLGSCLSVSFIAPALSGMALVDGMPPLECSRKFIDYGGLQYYSARRSLSQNLARGELCERALHLGFDRLWLLMRDVDSPELLRCRPQGGKG